MKKVIVLCLLIAFSVGIFAQAKTLDEMNGFDWVALTYESKIRTVQGWYLACIMVMSMTLELNAQLPKEDFNKLAQDVQNRFYYPETLQDMVLRMDNYYSTFDNRKYLVYRTIPFVSGKEWWNRITGKVEVSGPNS